MNKLAGDLKVGDLIDGQRIETIRYPTAFGIVHADWGFGHAETMDTVNGVTESPAAPS